MYVVSEIGIAPDVAVRPDVTVLSYVYVSFDVYASTDDAFLIQEYFAVDVCAVFDFSLDFCFELADEFLVDLDELPRTSHINPILVCLVPYDLFAVCNLQAHGIRYLIFTSL